MSELSGPLKARMIHQAKARSTSDTQSGTKISSRSVGTERGLAILAM